MTQFQLVALSLFAVAVLLANGKTVYTALAKVVAAVGQRVVSFGSASPSTVLGPRERVNDLVVVSELRDRLAQVGCVHGVEACTSVLRAIVDHPADCQK